jgi:arabinofuranosyltransferase
MPTRQRNLNILLIALSVYVLAAAAWVADDAYITLRTVDNFVNGYGLRWNVAERVQSYTHPLWMFALSAVYALTHQAYFTALLVCFVFSLATLIILARQPNAAVGLVILLCSKAFVDFSVSGLENPATHLLLLAFVLVFLTQHEWTDLDLMLMGFISAMIMLNRVDAGLFIIPALLFVLYKRFSARSLGLLSLGFLPFVLWELFSLFYYGFLVPNTAFAKLNTGIPQSALFSQGLVYFVDSFQRDPITLITIAVALILCAGRGNLKERLLGLGVSLYLLYILRIGGDFMSGRFFSAPLLVCVLLIMRQSGTFAPRWKLGLALLVVLIGFLAPYPTLLPRTNQPAYTENDLKTGINDERAFYYQVTGLPVVLANGGSLSDSQGWVEHGLALRNSGKTIAQESNIGFMGYYAGPGVYMVDMYALSDPLMARLPIPDPQHWRVGHFERDLPAGYIETLKSGTNQIKDPGLSAFYQKLSLITRGPLWSLARLHAIWEMNTGQDQPLLAAYLKE